MYRFMMEGTLFNQLQRQAISVSKRYYQCSGIGVYGYRPKKVESFERKSILLFLVKPINTFRWSTETFHGNNSAR